MTARGVIGGRTADRARESINLWHPTAAVPQENMGKKSKNKTKLQAKCLPKEERKERKEMIARAEKVLSTLIVRASPSRCDHWDSSKRQDVLLFLGGSEHGWFNSEISQLLEWSGLPGENKRFADALLGMAVELLVRYEVCPNRSFLLKRLIVGHTVLEKLAARWDIVEESLTFDEAEVIYVSESTTFVSNYESDKDARRYLSQKFKCKCLKDIKRELKKIPELSMCMNTACKEMKDKKELLLCSKCKVERYCSKDCQVAHWGEHKEVCKRLRREHKGSLNEK